MSTRTSTYRRIARRETHSSRAVLAIVSAVAVIAVCAWAVTEIVLMLASQPALIAPLPAVAAALRDLPSVPAAVLVPVGVAIAIAGLALLVGALAPGRRARRMVDSTSTAAIVDDAVIASAIARQAALAGNVDPDNVEVTVGRRRAIVRITPASGAPVHRATVHDAVVERLAEYRLTSPVRPQVIVASMGKVGS